MGGPKILTLKNFNFDQIKIRNSDVDFVSTLPEEIRQQTDVIWKEKSGKLLSEGKSIWDGVLYRVANVAEIEAYQRGEIEFELGVVNYRYPFVSKDLLDFYENNPKYRIHHFGIGAVILTSDNLFALGKRNPKKNIHADNVDLIGGTFNQDEQILQTGEDLKTSLSRELAEEAGIAPRDVLQTKAIGIIQSYQYYVQIICVVELNKTSSELDRIFMQKEDEEMSGMIYKSSAEIKDYLDTLPTYRPLVSKLLTNYGY
ncbi:MAG: NUDIX hydrolase [Candidatus Dojkabacteria bacterium]